MKKMLFSLLAIALTANVNYAQLPTPGSAERDRPESRDVLHTPKHMMEVGPDVAVPSDQQVLQLQSSEPLLENGCTPHDKLLPEGKTSSFSQPGESLHAQKSRDALVKRNTRVR